MKRSTFLKSLAATVLGIRATREITPEPLEPFVFAGTPPKLPGEVEQYYGVSIMEMAQSSGVAFRAEGSYIPLPRGREYVDITVIKRFAK
jgi:hypothetical protein